MAKGFIKWLKNCFIPNPENDYQPCLLRWRSFMIIIAVVVLTEAIFLLQTFLVFRKTNFFAEVLPEVLVELTNDSRKSQNIPELKIRMELQEAAQKKAEDMAKKGYFAHTSPEGLLPWHWFKEAGYDFSYAGENLAVNFFDSKDVNNAWLQSPSHKENILSKSFTEIGIGIAKGIYEGKESVFVVQLFGKPKEKKINVLAVKTNGSENKNEEPSNVVSPTLAPSPPVSAAETETKKIDSTQNTEEVVSQTNTVVEKETGSLRLPIAPEQPSKFALLFSMPRQATNYIFILILTIISVALFLEIFTPAFSKVKIPYSSLLSHGFLIFLIISLLILVNKYLNAVNAMIF